MRRFVSRSLPALAFGLLFSAEVAAEQRIKVEVDQRVELLAVVQHLAGARSKLPPATSAYAERVTAAFRKQRGAPAVQQIGVLAQRGFGVRDAAALAVRLGPLPDLDVPPVLPPALVEHAGGMKAVQQFTKLLRTFAKGSEFAKFFAEEKTFYDKLENEVQLALGPTDYATNVELFFGTRQAGYNLVLSALYPPETAMAPLASKSGLDVFLVAGPRGGTPDEPSFGTQEQIEEMVLREISRPFFSGLVGEFTADIKAFTPLLADVEPAMTKIGVFDWTSAFVELAMRAVAARQVAKVRGAKPGAAAADAYEKAGFAHVAAMANRMAEYEAGRNRYPDFATFFPRVIAVLGEIKQAKTPPPKLAKEGFDGTLLSALQERVNDGVIIVPPAGIKDRRVDKRVAKYLDGVARDVRTRRGGFVGVLDEWHATDRNLKSTLVWFFAAPGGRLVERYLPRDRAPTFPKKGALSFRGKDYKGKKLQVVQAVRAPESEVGAIVTTARTPLDLFGADRCVPEGAAWAVCSGGKLLDKGPPEVATASAAPPAVEAPKAPTSASTTPTGKRAVQHTDNDPKEPPPPKRVRGVITDFTP